MGNEARCVAAPLVHEGAVEKAGIQTGIASLSRFQSRATAQSGCRP